MPALTTRNYTSLRADIAELLADARAEAEDVLAHALAVTYWHIGQRIHTDPALANSANSATSADRAALLRRLATDLAVDLRTLQRALAFHRAYDEPPASRLTWGHYRTLLTLPVAHRPHYEQLAVDDTLSVRALTLAIDAAHHEHSAVADPAAKPAAPARKLKRPTTAGYVYLAVLQKVIDADTVILDIDLGFRTHAHQRIRLAALDAAPVDTPGGKRAKRYLQGLLDKHPHIAVQTRAIDIYGRYIGHLFCAERKQPLARLYARGIHVNQRLVDRRHATPL